MRWRAMAIAGVLACGAACAQDAPEGGAQRGGTFVEPPARIDPAYLPTTRTASSPDDRRTAGASGSPLQIRLALDVPLRHGGAVGFASQGPRAASPTLQADVRWTVMPDSRWFVRAVFLRYLRPAEQQPWNPDYFYSFGYEDGRPGTWSLTYANYTGTRWHPDAALNQGHANFSQGLWSAAWRFGLAESLRRVLLAGDGDDATCRAGFEWTPTFVDLASRSFRHNRTAATLGCRYVRPEGWFAEFTAYAYPERGKQQPWDPDFTYAVGWSDWRPGTLSIQYGNYSGNRYPGRARGPGEGALASGSVTVSWRLDW